MVSFQYVEFFDVPRTLTFRYKGKLLLLQSAFDQERDEYPDHYTVYLLPESAAVELASGSWKFLEKAPLETLGKIQVKDVQFDSSKRKKLDASILDKLLAYTASYDTRNS